MLATLSCAPRKAPAPVTPDATVTTRADWLLERGCYSCLKEALAKYEWVLTQAADRTDIRDKAARTALLLGLRERDLGIPGRACLEKSRPARLIRSLSKPPRFLNARTSCRAVPCCALSSRRMLKLASC